MSRKQSVMVIFRCLAALAALVWTTGLSGQQTEVDAVAPFWGNNSPGGRASGMAQAFTGIADDATALNFNPAGLAHATQLEINISLGHLNITTDVTDSAFHSSTSIAATRLGNLSLVVPIPHSRFTWAAAYQQVRGYDRRREITLVYDSQVQTESITLEGSLGAYSLGVAYQASPQLAIGGAFELLSGNTSYTARSTFLAPPDSLDILQIKPHYSGVNLVLGVLLAPIPQWRIGLLLRTPQKIKIDELSTDLTLDYWDSNEYSTRGSYYLRTGTSVLVRPLLLAADIYWFDYSQIKFESDLEDGGIHIDPEINGTIRSNFRSVTGWALGGEYLLPGSNVKMRCGYRLDPIFYHSNSNDAGKRTIALGLALVPVPALKLDITYTQTTWKISRFEKLAANNLSLGLVYRL